MIKSIIFDKDGVLLDLEATWLNSAVAMTHFLSELTKGANPPEIFQEIIGIDEHTRSIDADGLFAAGSMIEQFAAYIRQMPELEAFLIDNDTIKSQLRDVFLNARDKTLSTIGSVPNGDVITPLSELHASGLKLAVLTNDSASSAQRGCDDIGISSYLDMVVGFDSGYGSKPQPEGFMAICNALSVQPDEVVMVGDTYADRDVAKAAGAGAFVGISAIFPKAPKALAECSYLLPDLSDLPELVKEISVPRS